MSIEFRRLVTLIRVHWGAERELGASVDKDRRTSLELGISSVITTLALVFCVCSEAIINLYLPYAAIIEALSGIAGVDGTTGVARGEPLGD